VFQAAKEVPKVKAVEKLPESSAAADEKARNTLSTSNALARIKADDTTPSAPVEGAR